MRQFAGKIITAMLVMVCIGASAQEFPSKPIRIIVPTSVATTSDLAARFIAEEMARELNASVIVENKSGANGIVAVTQFLAAPADGHALLLTNSSLYANPALYKSVPYDPVKDFRILVGVNQVFLVLVAAPTLKVNSVKELVDYAKQRPNEVTYASASAGSSTHLGPELFAARAGIKLRHIPYKGGAQAITDTVGGHVDIAMTALPTAVSLVASGKLKALAVTGSHRSVAMPNVPTLAESGIVGAEITSKQAIVAPAGIPEAVAAKLTAVISGIISTPKYAKLLEVNGVEKEPMPPEAYAKIGADELKRWAEMVRLSGAKFD
jgi:tripartite-type tricarboxylate transporter receptor subunit TctC